MKIKEQLNSILSDNVWAFMIILVGFFAWFFGIDLYVLPITALYLLLMLIFCDDIKNLFAFIITIPSIINQFTDKDIPALILMGISAFFVIFGIIFYTVKQIKNHRNTLKKGKLFYAFIALMVSYMVGGLFIHFNILVCLLVVLFSLLTYFVYWSALNFSKNFRVFFRDIFIALGVMLAVQFFICVYRTSDNFLEALTSRSITTVGNQNINSIGLYFVFAIVSCFDAGLKKKHDYIYTILALFFLVSDYFIYSRTCLLLGVIFFGLGAIITFIYSKNKPVYIGIALCVLLGIYFLIIFKFDVISEMISWYIEMGAKGNGREVLWPWCWEKFVSSPIFGIGFASPENVPTIQTPHFVMVHNTLLQALTSTGIIGTIIVSYFYVKKYQLVFKGFKTSKIFPMLMIIIPELWGIVQPVSVNPFFIIISVIYLVLIENENCKLYATENNESEYSSSISSHKKLNKKLNTSEFLPQQIKMKNKNNAEIKKEKSNLKEPTKKEDLNTQTEEVEQNALKTNKAKKQTSKRTTKSQSKIKSSTVKSNTIKNPKSSKQDNKNKSTDTKQENKKQANQHNDKK